MAEKDVISTDRAPGPFQGAPYNQAIRVGDLVFVAGQLGISLETGALAGVGESRERKGREPSAGSEERGPCHYFGFARRAATSFRIGKNTSS